MTVNVQKQSTELNEEDQIGAFTNKAQSNTNSNKQEKTHNKEISLSAQNLNQESTVGVTESA